MNMNFLDLANRRHSLRKYAATPVPRAILDRCLEAARLAPSACNSQPWHFIVADREPLRTQLAAAAFSGLYSMNAFAKSAPVLIVAIRTSSRASAAIGGAVRGIQYGLIDVAIACEHIVLQAAEDGVGSCWLGWFNEKAVRKLLGISRTNRVDTIISLGYPAEETGRQKIRRELDAIRTFNP